MRLRYHPRRARSRPRPKVNGLRLCSVERQPHIDSSASHFSPASPHIRRGPICIYRYVISCDVEEAGQMPPVHILFRAKRTPSYLRDPRKTNSITLIENVRPRAYLSLSSDNRSDAARAGVSGSTRDFGFLTAHGDSLCLSLPPSLPPSSSPCPSARPSSERRRKQILFQPNRWD